MSKNGMARRAKKPMRIAQVAPLYESVPPRLYGGTERVVSWITEELVAMGHDVTLFASGDSITNARLVPVCPRALRLDRDCKDPLAHHVILMDQVFRAAPHFDLIHMHVDYLHFPLSKRSEVPCVSTLHGRLDLPDLVPIYQAFREQPLVSISDAQRAPLPWANWKGTVRHGMPKELLSFSEGEGKYLAFLGRISPEKGVTDAIEIARRAGIPLKIAAKVDHADLAYFENQVKPLLKGSLVEFIGEIGNEEKNEFLGNAAALIFPIDWPEPFGLVMIEALACGTPVIAYPRGSVPEIIVDGNTGFVVAGSDQAVDAVKRLGEIDRNRCRQHFERNFTAERMAHEYVDIYERLVRGEPTEPTALTVTNGVLSWMDLVPNTTT